MARAHPRLPPLATTLLVIVGAYIAISYVALPYFWTDRERRLDLAERPMVTRNADGIAGDPLNVGLVGTRETVVRAMHAAGWAPADPVTLRSAIEIVGSVLLDRPYRDAPVSPLFYEGRREDLAFEMEAGGSADRRHHVRLWQVTSDDEPLWLGAASFDRGVGISRYTGEVTHEIAADIDAERDFLVDGLAGAGMVAGQTSVPGVGPTRHGRNGEGTLYQTDGQATILVLATTLPAGQ